jgi:hypothetical protein
MIYLVRLLKPKGVAVATKSKQLTPFKPVPLRARHDGWTPEKQVAFIEALAASGCVDEACQRVGMHRSSAYELRARPEAESFRAAWQAALSHAIQRLEDAAFSRALNGVARPVFYKGELIGERRYHDERLTMFLLRYRDPARYGRWRDQMRVDVPAAPRGTCTSSSTAFGATPGARAKACPMSPMSLSRRRCSARRGLRHRATCADVASTLSTSSSSHRNRR